MDTFHLKLRLNLNDDPSASISLHYGGMKPLSVSPVLSFHLGPHVKIEIPIFYQITILVSLCCILIHLHLLNAN